ncbi:hypothetical protein SVAN01_10398 [Stagonosporopsis vannaccii]|nr:hypothetical protein SVAN01_10398 [Stagonosporopsis vannaccii]
MCTTVRYWYTCKHDFRLRRSQCGGTKHKRSKSGPVPACKSEPYLNMILRNECGPCQHLAFEQHRRRKLSRAELFLDKLKENGNLGVQEVAALVEKLKDEFNAMTWDTRSLFPHAHKDRAVRVSLGHFVRRPSPLRHEVLQEDIRERPVRVNLNYAGHKYDWDYIASTDPLHPVDTIYAHPLDDVDLSWVLDHLSREELEQTCSGDGFDPNEADALWSDNAEQPLSPPTSYGESSGSYSPENAIDTEQQGQKPGQKHAVTKEPTSASTPIKASTAQVERKAERIDIVVEEFWQLVNGDDHDQSRQHNASVSNADLLMRLEDLCFSDPSSSHKPLHTTLPTSPQTPPRSSPDQHRKFYSLRALSLSTQDSPPYSHEAHTDHHDAAIDLPFPNSTGTPYMKIHQHINMTKTVDKEWFYSDCLGLSRYEISDYEGVDGRLVQDPQEPQEIGARNGWWR